MNKQWLLFNVTSVLIIIYFSTTQVQKIGKIKSQEINYETQEKYEFPMNEHLKLKTLMVSNGTFMIENVRKD